MKVLSPIDLDAKNVSDGMFVTSRLKAPSFPTPTKPRRYQLLQHGSATGGGSGISAARATGDAVKAARAARVGIAKRQTMIVPRQSGAHLERDDERRWQEILKCLLTLIFNHAF